jgi:hypothetical protein
MFFSQKWHPRARAVLKFFFVLQTTRYIFNHFSATQKWRRKVEKTRVIQCCLSQPRSHQLFSIRFLIPVPGSRVSPASACLLLLADQQGAKQHGVLTLPSPTRSNLQIRQDKDCSTTSRCWV